MLVKLIELHKPQGDRVFLDEIYVQATAVTTIRAESSSGLIEEAMQFGISENAQFSKITISEGGVTRIATVIGSPAEIRNKLNRKQLLRD